MSDLNLDSTNENRSLFDENFPFGEEDPFDDNFPFEQTMSDSTTPQSRITISDAGPVAENQNIITGDEVIDGNLTFTYQNPSGDETLRFVRPQAAVNIFDDEYYFEQYEDLSVIEDKYADASLGIKILGSTVPEIAPSGLTQIQTSGGGSVTVDGDNVTTTDSLLDYSTAIEHYVAFGASEGRNPNALFDVDYYLEQNPDVATAVAGGSFEGDPLLHYVSAGASEGRDPNAYFDTSYYVEQNAGVAESGLNPLEHYVLYGSSSGADPSPNFDPQQYLAENPDVATAGIDPLTHFLTSEE